MRRLAGELEQGDLLGDAGLVDAAQQLAEPVRVEKAGSLRGEAVGGRVAPEDALEGLRRLAGPVRGERSLRQDEQTAADREVRSHRVGPEPEDVRPQAAHGHRAEVRDRRGRLRVRAVGGVRELRHREGLDVERGEPVRPRAREARAEHGRHAARLRDRRQERPLRVDARLADAQAHRRDREGDAVELDREVVRRERVRDRVGPRLREPDRGEPGDDAEREREQERPADQRAEEAAPARAAQLLAAPARLLRVRASEGDAAAVRHAAPPARTGGGSSSRRPSPPPPGTGRRATAA